MQELNNRIYEIVSGDNDKEIISTAIDKFPYSLAFPLAQFNQRMLDKNYDSAKNHLLDLFELSAIYISWLAFVILQSSNSYDKTIIRIIRKIEQKRSLSFGDWVNDILMPLVKALKSCEDESAQRLYKTLNQYVYNGKNRCIYLGDGKDEKSIIQIRNHYRGHGTTLSNDIYRALIEEFEPRLVLLLKGLMPLADYDYIALTPNEKAIRANGSKIETINPDSSMDKAHYYVCDKSTGRRYDLYPLAVVNDKCQVYLIQTLYDESITMISAHNEAPTIIANDTIYDLNRAFRKSLESFDVYRRLNYDKIVEYTHNESKKFILQIYKEKKYNRELFVERRQLSGFYKSFLASSSTLCVMPGEAGQGKTNLLCSWTEDLIDKGLPVIIFNCSKFYIYNLESKLKDIFNCSPRKNITTLLEGLHNILVEQNKQIYFLFDALNECLNYDVTANANSNTRGEVLLFNDICKLLISEQFPCFKVLITCRIDAWKNVVIPNCDLSSLGELNYKFDDNEIDVIKGFTPEETIEAYKVYQRLYQMDTAFDDIAAPISVRLRDPLILKFTAQDYLSEQLSENISDFSTITIFSKFMDTVGRSYAGNDQQAIILALADYILDRYLAGEPIDRVSLEAIHDAYCKPEDPLYALSCLIFKKEGSLSVSYTELINKSERPLLREEQLLTEDDDELHIDFIYERFLEFVLALCFKQRFGSGSKVIEVLSPNSSAYINGVFLGALKNVLLMDFDPRLLIEITVKHSDNFYLTRLVSDVVDTMIKEDYESQLYSLFEQLMILSPLDINNIAKFVEIENLIQSEGDAYLSLRMQRKELQLKLADAISLNKLATVSLFNGVLLSDFYNESLYTSDFNTLLLRLFHNPIPEIRNDACMYAYYLAKRHKTASGIPLKQNLSEMLVMLQYGTIKESNIIRSISIPSKRKITMTLLESATRLAVLLIIDSLMATPQDRKMSERMLHEIRQIMRHISFNYNLLRVIMPFMQMLMKRQITFQSEYVNNGVEYQSFWDNITYHSDDNAWSKEHFAESIQFVYHHQRYGKANGIGDISDECRAEVDKFLNFCPRILSAYQLGDALSYFVIERLLVIMGVSNWDNVRCFFQDVFVQIKGTQWEDYSRMSLLYSLYQIAVHTRTCNDELLKMYTDECRLWTLSCIGSFKARNSERAFPQTGKYKRNVLSWYAAVYCTYYGGESKLPLFYELIDEAIATKNRTLLLHIIDNVTEIVTDMGLVDIATNLMLYIISKFDSNKKLSEFDNLPCNYHHNKKLNILVREFLSTAKNYRPQYISNFIKTRLSHLPFPGIKDINDDILSYHPSGESLSDLLTHKFGNFLMWSLLNEKSVDDFAFETITAAPDSGSSFKWFEKVVKILFSHLFSVKL